MNYKISKVLKKIGNYIPILEPYLYKILRDKSPMSKGEEYIANWLKINDIKYKSEYLIKTKEIVKHKIFMFADFYLPKYNTIIEYNGRQYYEFTPFFHKTEEDFKLQQKRDKYLEDYCKSKGMHLIVVSYKVRYKDFNNFLWKQLSQKMQKVK